MSRKNTTADLWLAHKLTTQQLIDIVNAPEHTDQDAAWIELYQRGQQGDYAAWCALDLPF